MLEFSVIGTPQAQQLNVSFAQGDVVAWALAGQIQGSPINLTGYVIKLTIGFQTPLVLSTSNGGIEVINAAAGQFQINMSSAQTAAFVPGIYPYDIWFEYQSSPPVENQLWTGTVSVLQSETIVP